MTATPIKRRTFLRGVGLSMGLPMLNAMSSTSFGGETKKAAPLRSAFVFFPNGAIMPSWNPKGEGAEYELSETLSKLKEHKKDFLVFSGLAQDNGRAKGDGPGDHARCAASYLTGAHPVKTSGANIKNGISVDQIAAAHIGKLTKLPSLEIGLERGRNAGNCDSGYSCAYSNNVSWKTATTPVAKEINPRLVFERLFGSSSLSDRKKARRDFYRQSILDVVAADAKQLRAKVGETDKRKLDEYFNSVRELELRIARSETGKSAPKPDFEPPEGKPRDHREYVRLMYDLLVLAFQTDTTRVATYMLGNAGSNKSYPMVNVREGHHQLSHHRNDKDKVAKLQRIDSFLISEFSYFLAKLKSVKEGEGTLLDNSMIVYGSGLGDGNRHQHSKLPILLAGRGGGTIDPGRHIQFRDEVPLNNLFLSLLDRIGAGIKSFGDGSGRISELTT